MVPDATTAYYTGQRALTLRLLVNLRRVWATMDPAGNWTEQYLDDIGPKLRLLVAVAQRTATQDADTYMRAVLTELGIRDDARGAIATNALAGLAGDGRPVDTLLDGSIVTAGRAYDRRPAPPAPDQAVVTDRDGNETRIEQYAPAANDPRPMLTPAEALQKGGNWLDGIATTVLADTGRAAVAIGFGSRPAVSGWVRMISPPCCSRCAVLAGKFYRWNTGFLRHPLCKCRHIPAVESLAGDLTTDPVAYFDSLSAADQDGFFTKSGAEAIRAGADPSQVVNARRGMNTAQPGVGRATRTEVFGRQTFITREGITVRGVYGRNRSELAKARGDRYRASQRPRLMPESIFEIAKDRDDAIRLLKLNSFIL